MTNFEFLIHYLQENEELKDIINEIEEGDAITLANEFCGIVDGYYEEFFGE